MLLMISTLQVINNCFELKHVLTQSVCDINSDGEDVRSIAEFSIEGYIHHSHFPLNRASAQVESKNNTIPPTGKISAGFSGLSSPPPETLG